MLNIRISDILVVVIFVSFSVQDAHANKNHKRGSIGEDKPQHQAGHGISHSEQYEADAGDSGGRQRRDGSGSGAGAQKEGSGRGATEQQIDRQQNGTAEASSPQKGRAVSQGRQQSWAGRRH